MLYFAIVLLLSCLTVVMLIRAIVQGVKDQNNTAATLVAAVSFALLNLVHLYLAVISS